MFDSTLAQLRRACPAPLCVHSETCGTALALEHNGDLYSCDHFVEPDHLLGNIRSQHLLELVASPQQLAFGRAKRDSLPAYCRSCDVRFACHGGCPKDRFTVTPDGEPGLHYLCPSYLEFFHHVDRPMRFMAAALRRGGFADEVMGWTRQQREQRQREVGTDGRVEEPRTTEEPDLSIVPRFTRSGMVAVPRTGSRTGRCCRRRRTRSCWTRSCSTATPGSTSPRS